MLALEFNDETLPAEDLTRWEFGCQRCDRWDKRLPGIEVSVNVPFLKANGNEIVVMWLCPVCIRELQHLVSEFVLGFHEIEVERV
jgi:hypothetical protein